MPRISLPPFLKKLQSVTKVVKPETAHWSEDGTAFIVEKPQEFEKTLGQYFKGSLLTFIRQLHFYGFRKVDIKGDKWSFSHACFRRDMEHLIYEIRRKTRTETNDGVASQLEVQALRDHVGKLTETVNEMSAGMAKMREELASLKQSLKRDSMKAKLESDDFDFSMVSNGGSAARKKQKTVMSYEPLSDGGGSLGSFEGSFNDFAEYLPFTDGSFEALSGSSSE